MKTQDTRLKKLEQQLPVRERQFLEIFGGPWTEEEKVEAIRENPERTVFLRPLVSKKMHLEVERKRKVWEQERDALVAKSAPPTCRPQPVSCR